VEREAYAASILVARMAEGFLAPAPVWSDLSTFDGREWRGVVDLVTSGIPCQPYSAAGKQRGHDDERALWPELVRIVGECRPSLVFIENVPTFAGWFREPGQALCRMGYEIEDAVFLAAEDVGAPHSRERVFILAHRHGDEQRADERVADTEADWRNDSSGSRTFLGHTNEPREDAYAARGGSRRAVGESGGQVADAIGSGHDRRADGEERRAERRDVAQGPGEELGHAGSAYDAGREPEQPPGIGPSGAGEGLQLEHSIGPRREAARLGRDEYAGGEPETGREPVSHFAQRSARDTGRWPPAPDDRDEWARILAERPDLAPAVESPLRGMADGLPNRMDRLRALGNGVVPAVAAAAFRELLRRTYER
jgi:DNA (cytosine-5)-methyltransferase 1